MSCQRIFCHFQYVVAGDRDQSGDRLNGAVALKNCNERVVEKWLDLDSEEILGVTDRTVTRHHRIVVVNKVRSTQKILVILTIVGDIQSAYQCRNHQYSKCIEYMSSVFSQLFHGCKGNKNLENHKNCIKNQTRRKCRD